MSKKRRELQAQRGALRPTGGVRIVYGSGVSQGRGQQLPALERRLWGVAGFLVVVTLVLYLPIYSHPFTHYDDPLYITENAHVQAGLSGETLSWALRTFQAGNWHPVTWVAHALDYQIFGASAGGHHFVSALLHALNAALVFLLLGRATRAIWRSALVALLFAAHPLNVESVAWAAELKTVLCTFFFLLGLGAYGWYARKPEAKRYAAVAVCFALSLAAKPMGITFPFVLLLMDVWPMRRLRGWPLELSVRGPEQKTAAQLVMEKLPLFAMCVASAIVTIMAQRTTSSVVPMGVASGTIAPIGLEMRMLNALHSYGAYLWKGTWPAGLAVFYPFPFRTLTMASLLLPAVVLIAICGIVWRFRREEPSLLVGWLFYLGTLVPMIGRRKKQEK